MVRLTQDMYRLVTQPGSQIIHVMPQDYKVDYEEGISDPVGYEGVRLEGNFHIITAQSTAINNINKCVTKAGPRNRQPDSRTPRQLHVHPLGGGEGSRRGPD